jgi:hypothetical protein
LLKMKLVIFHPGYITFPGISGNNRCPQTILLFKANVWKPSYFLIWYFLKSKSTSKIYLEPILTSPSVPSPL